VQAALKNGKSFKAEREGVDNEMVLMKQKYERRIAVYKFISTLEFIAFIALVSRHLTAQCCLFYFTVLLEQTLLL
jgi:hypothetical protein